MFISEIEFVDNKIAGDKKSAED